MSDDRPTVRVACRRRMTLDGADAEALEYALTMVERELAEALKLLAGQVSEVARLRGLLREVEWIDASWLAGECPICVRQRVLGHAPDCRLAAALEKDHG